MAETKSEKPVPYYYWDPTNMVGDMQRAFDNVRMKLGDVAYMAGNMLSPRIPAMDCRKEEDAYVLEIEIPGLTREDISIEVSEDTLYIQAQKEEAVEEKREDYIRRERGSMSFYRSVPLSENVDKSNISAKLDNGVLRVVLPKLSVPEEPKRRVSIE